MKKIFCTILSSYFLLATFYSFAQVPQRFNYQGIARDAKGNPMAKQQLSLKLAVLPTQDATDSEYEETQHVITNEFGLYTLQIGNGTPVTSEMKTVKWETGNKYIKVAIDPKGGNDFVDAGTSQLLSVPYAIYADKAGMAKTAGGDRTGAVNSNATHIAGDANYLTKFTALNTIGKSQLYENGTNIGIGTTSPAARLHLYSNVAGVQQHLRMQNADSIGVGRFTMYNDSLLSYATFSKYGTKYPGGYTGIPTLYPYANLLAFGNNGKAANDGLGRFLISSGGNVGISVFKSGTSKLKFHADYATENVGIGGNAAPASRVHLNNTDGTSMDLRLTNTTTGHTATDGMTIAMSGNIASINNRENSSLVFATNNNERARISSNGDIGIGTISPTAKLDINGQIRIQGGVPDMHKVLTSDSAGLATWQSPASSYDAGSSVSIPSNGSDVIILTSSTPWVGGKGIMVLGNVKVDFPNVPIGDYFLGDVEVWVEYLHPSYGLIKFKNRYHNIVQPNANITLSLAHLLPSVAGIPFKIGIRNYSVYWDSITSSYIPVTVNATAEMQGLEM